MATRHARIVLAAFTLAWMAGCQTAGKTGAQAMKAKVKPGTSVLAGTHAKNHSGGATTGEPGAPPRGGIAI